MHSFILAVLLAVGPDPAFGKPSITRIHVGPDTVWFTGHATVSDTISRPVAYAYVRATGAWLLLPAPVLPPSSLPSIPQDSGASMALSPRWTFVCLTQGYGSCSAGALRDVSARASGSRTRRLVAPRPYPPSRTMNRVDPSSEIVSFASGAGAYWFGLGGGESEGVGTRGGLLRVDTLTGAIRYVAGSLLDDVTVTTMTWDGAALWIGTEHPGEYGAYGTTGLVRYEPTQQRWTSYTEEQSALPDNRVVAIGQAAGVVAVATNNGLALRDGSTDRWTRTYFNLEFAGDSIVHMLRSAPDSRAAEREALFLEVRDLGVRNRRAVYDALWKAWKAWEARGARTADGASDGNRTNADQPFSVAAELAQPGVIDLLVGDVLRAPAAVAPIVVTAVGLAGARDAAPALRSLLAGQGEHALEAAIALVRLGDSAGGQWIQDRLRTDPLPGMDWDVLQARVVGARAAGRARDTGSLPIIFALLQRPIRPAGASWTQDNATLTTEVADTLLATLAAFKSPAVWRRLGQLAARSPEVSQGYLRLLDSMAVGDPATRAAAHRIAASGMADADVRLEAFQAAARVLRDPKVADAIVTAMNEPMSPEDWWAASSALVSLTGLGDVPSMSYRAANQAQVDAAVKYWTAWRAGRATSFVPVTWEEGWKALNEWQSRSWSDSGTDGSASQAGPGAA